MAKIKIPKEVMIKLLEQNLQSTRIAEELLISRPTVIRICKEHGLFDWLKKNGKAAQIKHNKTVRWIHGGRSRDRDRCPLLNGSLPVDNQ